MAPKRDHGRDHAARHPQKQNNDQNSVGNLPQLAELDQDLVNDSEGDRPDDGAEQGTDTAEGQHHQHDDVYLADEAFFTGTAAEVTPIRELDRRVIGKGSRGPVTQKIQNAFFDVVNGKNPEYKHWLTPV